MRRTSARGEGGESLIEALVAMMICGVAVAATIGLLGTTILSSRMHRDRTDASVVLIDALESVKQQPYVACTTAVPASYNPTLGLTLPYGWTAAHVSVTGVEGWDGTAGLGWRSCPAADTGLERVTVRATSPDGNQVETAHVLKRVP